MGTHLNWFTDFFVDYFPMYDKFRAVTMIMIIAQFSIALFAVMALNKFINDDNNDKLKGKNLKTHSTLLGVLRCYFFGTILFFRFHFSN